MKGKLNIGVPISNNEILAIGTEVEIINGWCGCDGYFYQCEIAGGRQIVINSNNIEITDHRPYIDWEQRRYELAKAAMQGFCAKNSHNNLLCDDVAELSIHQVNALIRKLKEYNHGYTGNKNKEGNS